MEDSWLYYFGVVSGLIIVLVNWPIIWIIWKERILTWINCLIGLDCFLCLGMIPIILSITNVIDLPCGFITSYAFFASLLNRLLPVGIVIYRYVYACHSSLVLSASQRKAFNFALSTSIIVLTILLTFGSWMYKDQYLYYLNCMGNEHLFTDSPARIDGFVWLLPVYHPFHLLSIFAFFLYSVLVPIGYILIYIFRDKHDGQMLGLCERSRLIRNHKNIVTTSFNLLIWIFEIISFVPFMMFQHGEKAFSLVYFLIGSTTTPVIYYIGMEVNRMAAKKRLMTLFKELRENGKKIF